MGGGAGVLVALEKPAGDILTGDGWGGGCGVCGVLGCCVGVPGVAEVGEGKFC